MTEKLEVPLMLSDPLLTQVEPAYLLRMHYALQRGSFVSELSESTGGLLALSTVIAAPIWNHAAWLNGAQSEFAPFIRHASESLSARGRRPIIYVPNSISPAQAEMLKAAGYEKFDEEAWMTCVHSASSFQQSPAVKKIDDQQSLEAFLQVFSAAFQTKEGDYRRILSKSEGAEFHSEHFVLYDQDSKPVSVGTLIQDGTVGCIYNVGTPPRERGKGFGSQIFEHIVATARTQGCTTLFLQVENSSAPQRLYEKRGFQTAFVRSGYRLASWQPAKAERTHLSTLLGFRSPDKGLTRYLRESRPLPPGLIAALPNQENSARENLYIAAWACLLHCYSRTESVTFTLCRGIQSGKQPVSVTIPPSMKLGIWLENPQLALPAALDDASETCLRLPGSDNSSHVNDREFPLELKVLPETERIEISFRADLFAKDSIRRMGAHFTNILEFIARHPEARIRDIDLLSPAEKHQLLVEWNQTDFQVSAHSLVQLFEAQVEKTPDATALLLARNGVSQAAEQMTYRQLNRKANRLAHRLQELGVKPEVFVGVCLDRSLDMIVALLAILKAGGACVPLDPSYPTERLAFMVQDTSAPVILTHRHLAPILGTAVHAKLVFLDESGGALKSESEKNIAPPAMRNSAAYVIYTSGSTGKPKGVVITNPAIANHCLDCRKVYGLSSKDRVLQFSSFNFDASFEQILPALISGACLVIRDNEVWNTREFGDKLRDLQLTVTDIPTAYWHQLASEWSAHPEAVPPNPLRLVIVGGEALSPEKLGLWQRGPLGHVRLINAYGPTETTITATSFEVAPKQPGDHEAAVLPIGRPRADRKAYVLDPDGNPAPIGLPGELHIGGLMLAREYHRRPDLTAERFIPNPFSDEPDARLYRTGDLVRYLEDGNLEFLGRIDHQVKIRGFRIELGEIEAALNKHPNVRDAIVLTRADSSGENRLLAYVVAPSQPPSPTELRHHLKSRLPDYMVPTNFLVLETWPLMPNGKVDRKALPEPVEEIPETVVKGPEDPLELQLQLLFERVLKRACVAVNISFFELGGDSLQALELLVQIEKATGKQLPLGTLYQSSTVETIAREVRSRASHEEWSSLVPLQTSGARPPLFLLHTTPGDILGYGNLVYRLGADQPCYGLQSLGLKEAALSHTDVRTMAEYYVGLLRAFQPHGPYFLGGWCYGGIVAVEMARILRTAGERIALLALLETVAMPAPITNARYYLNRLRCFLRMSPERWISYFRAKARYARESRVANRIRFRQSDTLTNGDTLDPRLAKLEHVYNTNLAALNTYRSELYDGKVTLFNAAEKDAALIPDPLYGWAGLAREIEVHDVPGNHDTMLTEPNVSDLAQRLNDCLIRAQRILK